SIEDRLLPHMDDRCVILIANDRRDKDFTWHDEDANTGVFLIRNTPVARHILEEWWHVPEYDPSTAVDWPVDQRAFNRHIRPRWSNGWIRMFDYALCKVWDGQYIRY